MGIIRLSQTMPDTPLPLFPVAAMVPATFVPWPYTSEVSELLLYTFQPETISALKSGCVPSTPVSSTATIRPLEPIDWSHAVSLEIVERCHWEGNNGSSGTFDG